MSDHIPDPGKMVSARDEAVERALMAAWCNPPTSNGMTDAEAFLSALAAAGYAVVPMEDTQSAVELIDMWAGDNSDRANLAVWTAIRQLRAMLAAAKETQVCVGDASTYEALCRKHYLQPA